jgi:hypothetical protein
MCVGRKPIVPNINQQCSPICRRPLRQRACSAVRTPDDLRRASARHTQWSQTVRLGRRETSDRCEFPEACVTPNRPRSLQERVDSVWKISRDRLACSCELDRRLDHSIVRSNPTRWCHHDWGAMSRREFTAALSIPALSSLEVLFDAHRDSSGHRCQGQATPQQLPRIVRILGDP